MSVSYDVGLYFHYAAKVQRIDEICKQMYLKCTQTKKFEINALPHFGLHSIRFKVNNSGSQWRAFFYALYDSHNPLFPYFVAKHQACRNNSDKYLAFFLESAKNFLTFVMSIRTNDV